MQNTQNQGQKTAVGQAINKQTFKYKNYLKIKHANKRPEHESKPDSVRHIQQFSVVMREHKARFRVLRVSFTLFFCLSTSS